MPWLHSSEQYNDGTVPASAVCNSCGRSSVKHSDMGTPGRYQMCLEDAVEALRYELLSQREDVNVYMSRDKWHHTKAKELLKHVADTARNMLSLKEAIEKNPAVVVA